MPTFVSDLQPTALWAHFDHILTIPRGSGNEAAMRAYVLEVAERNGLEHQQDEVGNVVVRKPGAPGYEDAPITILQSHLDMVNEKNSDVDHDFSRDPLEPAREGEYLKARGTTLGSDNGIGVAAMLAIMEADDVAHGPLELLFTIDEETGLTGAGKLDGSMLRGRRLLNLDTEEEGAHRLSSEVLSQVASPFAADPSRSWRTGSGLTHHPSAHRRVQEWTAAGVNSATGRI